MRGHFQPRELQDGPNWCLTHFSREIVMITLYRLSFKIVHLILSILLRSLIILGITSITDTLVDEAVLAYGCIGECNPWPAVAFPVDHEAARA